MIPVNLLRISPTIYITIFTSLSYKPKHLTYQHNHDNLVICFEELPKSDDGMYYFVAYYLPLRASHVSPSFSCYKRVASN